MKEQLVQFVDIPPAIALNDRNQCIDVFYTYLYVHIVVIPLVVLVIHMLANPLLFVYVVFVAAVGLSLRLARRKMTQEVGSYIILSVVLMLFLYCRLEGEVLVMLWTWTVLVGCHCVCRTNNGEKRKAEPVLVASARHG
jgi:predicted membrane protein